MKKRVSIADKLLNYGVLINNSIDDPEISNALNAFGYTPEKLNAAKSLLSETETLVQTQIKEYGEQFEATETVNNLWTAANEKYTETLKIARIALKNHPSAQAALSLQGNRKKSLSGWLLQTNALYNNLEGNSEYMDAMAVYGYTAEKLSAEKTMIEELEAAKHTQAKEKGEAQQATLDRDNKLDDLDEWISEFKVIARIALQDKPQWLEKLGILERS